MGVLTFLHSIWRYVEILTCCLWMCAKNGFEYLEKNIFFEHVNTNIVYPKAYSTHMHSSVEAVLDTIHATEHDIYTHDATLTHDILPVPTGWNDKTDKIIFMKDTLSLNVQKRDRVNCVKNTCMSS